MPFLGKETEAEKHAAFEEAVGGVSKAEQMQRLWNNSYPVGTKYDYSMKTGVYRSKEQVFWIKAKREGFTDKQIKMFLSL